MPQQQRDDDASTAGREVNVRRDDRADRPAGGDRAGGDRPVDGPARPVDGPARPAARWDAEPAGPPKNEHGQVVLPAGTDPRHGLLGMTGPLGSDGPHSVPDPLAMASATASAADQFLIEHGWEKLIDIGGGRAMWRDPISAGSHKGVRFHAANLPGKEEGKHEELWQTLVPPIRWDLTTEDAVRTQRSRMEAAAAGRPPLERLDALAAAAERAAEVVSAAAARLEQLTRRPIPERTESLRAELILMRRHAAGTASELRAAVDPRQLAAADRPVPATARA